MDAVTYLRQEHSKVRKMLHAISKIANEKPKLAKFKVLAKDLTRHEKMEETIWYPVLRKDPDLRSLIKHLVQEEKAAGKAIKKLLAMEFGTLWKLKFLKFKMDVNHHAKDEEKELFPKARKFLSKAELNKLGAKMRKFKASLK